MITYTHPSFSSISNPDINISNRDTGGTCCTALSWCTDQTTPNPLPIYLSKSNFPVLLCNILYQLNWNSYSSYIESFFLSVILELSIIFLSQTTLQEISEAVHSRSCHLTSAVTCLLFPLAAFKLSFHLVLITNVLCYSLPISYFSLCLWFNNEIRNILFKIWWWKIYEENGLKIFKIQFIQ